LAAEEVLRLATEAGCPAFVAPRGPTHSLIEIWLDDRILLEVTPPERIETYERLCSAQGWMEQFGLTEENALDA
jgi:hypothetical protein